MNKEVHVTASTGISRLQFKGGATLHHWSGYGDGHLPVDNLIQELSISAIYEKTRENIKKCEVLIVDEIGMISSKMVSEVELICRTIKQNSLTFGGIQVIGSGSFFQLPPVPSGNDKGMFAFQANCFHKILPHKMHLNIVHRQKELDFVRCINDLCEGNPSPRTHQLLLSLKRPIQTDSDTVYIFGTNYDVDFFNHMKLETVNGTEHLFTADDSGERLSYKKCGAPKYLLLKPLCKVVVTRNLYNGLVNGISGTVLDLQEGKVTIKVDEDRHLNHALQGKTFDVSPYTFIKRDADNIVTSVRKQIPLKLGYAVTVDKSQGRTLDSVVVDSTNFWCPGQLGVAIGRTPSKEAVHLLAYNQNAAGIRHPQSVLKFYEERSLLMRQDLSCCAMGNIDASNFLIKHYAEPAQLPNFSIEETSSEYLEQLELKEFPFEVEEYINKLTKELPKVTHIQMEQIQILQDAKQSKSFRWFLSKAYTVISDIFLMYKVTPKKNKCNWCRMCSHLHTIFCSTSYKSDILKAFNRKKVHSNENAICTRVYFNLLEVIAHKEACDVKSAKLEKFLSQQPEMENFDSLDKSSLRYIAGATIHVFFA